MSDTCPVCREPAKYRYIGDRCVSVKCDDPRCGGSGMYEINKRAKSDRQDV